MSYAVEPQIFEKFRGIREFNGVNSGGAISALVCKNVELVQSEIGDGTGIKTMEGNSLAYELPSGFALIELFESVQENITYTIIYGENENEGKLFYIGVDNILKEIAGGFSVTGQANGITMSSTAYDVFVFTNGKEVRTICFTVNSEYQTVIEGHNPTVISGGGYMAEINAQDVLGRNISWLAMTEWNGFLVVCSPYGVHSSHQNDIYTWNDNAEHVANSWYIDFGKETTAIVSFTGGLYVFTSDDVTYISTTPNDTANSTVKTVAMNGCFSYQSLVKHDTFLFFYDNNQKNIYYMHITDTGQTRPAGPVAKEIQSCFSDVKRFKMYSCVYNTHNEIWCIINDEILIYDYAQQEWITRQEQEINSIAIVKNLIYSGDNYGNIRVEGVNRDFDGTYYPSVYETTYINLGTNTNMKKQKTPLLLTLDTSYTNDFYVQIICNSKLKNPKHIKISNSRSGTYAGDDVENPPDTQKYDSAVYAIENAYNKKVVEISTPQTWYNLGIKIYTEKPGQGFYIQSMELKNIKAKSKTRGR